MAGLYLREIICIVGLAMAVQGQSNDDKNVAIYCSMDAGPYPPNITFTRNEVAWDAADAICSECYDPFTDLDTVDKKCRVTLGLALLRTGTKLWVKSVTDVHDRLIKRNCSAVHVEEVPHMDKWFKLVVSDESEISCTNKYSAVCNKKHHDY